MSRRLFQQMQQAALEPPFTFVQNFGPTSKVPQGIVQHGAHYNVSDFRMDKQGRMRVTFVRIA